ncbi:AMP-dependent synthetase/ligase [Granulicella arctica]|uniref:Long-chain acyl-CoA synthetase n=1 Tax=Granulicella arctica TaxID=940613 RepID=A0A7Y9TM17_9BACT|nr:long-chain fatty acid--CoA ligase [Granulicella arctica]NYF80697.1 long-chain acyl-CoA synthetase [Granulicella arctica]
MLLNVATVNDVFARISVRGEQTVMVWQDSDGAWKPISSAELYGRVRALADVLTAWGIIKGDRVALLSENRWEWAVTDFATLALGAVDVPLYPTLTAEHVGYMLRDSEAKVVIVSSAEQYAKIAEAGDLPALEHVVVMDSGSFANAESFAALMSGAPERKTANVDFDAQVKSITPADLATIIYTSGTTGEPKGVMLTHGNLGSNINISTGPMGFNGTDSCISFLPLSHVTARHTDYALICQEVRLAYCPKFDQLAPSMQAVKPTIFLAVPRVYEKIRQAVEGKSAHSPLKSRILRWAIGVGKKHRQETLEGKTPSSLSWKLANKLVFSKIRTAFGGCARTFISGGAPLGMDTAGWFADAGIRILEGYGLTETSPVIAVNYPEAYRIGTVGKPLSNMECRFAQDGELEVRGPAVFKGYWKKPKETEEAFTPDSWFKTGDIGAIDRDGFLSITDRKKELLKTSGGKLIAPQPIENKLKANTFVAQAALVGDKHKFACVLISPNFAALEGWAKGQGLSTSDRNVLSKDPKVVKLYQDIVDQVNRSLSQYESMKRLTVVPDEWSVEDGTLTPSMKMKRRVVEQRYAAQIADFYADEATSTR